MDCIESVRGDQQALLSLVDRCSREVILMKLTRQSQAAVIRALNGLERQLGSKGFREKFKTITVDNGSEFQSWEGLERSVFTTRARTRIYYANPYRAWERGSNENANGFVRYVVKKGMRIRDWSREEIRHLQNWINHYPRRILGGVSAASLSQAAAAA